jgi:hypothetical protein
VCGDRATAFFVHRDRVQVFEAALPAGFRQRVAIEVGMATRAGKAHVQRADAVVGEQRERFPG